MSRILTAYFSASGVTAAVAKKIAEATGSDMFEIVPEQRYTAEDLDWRNELSRSSVEMKNKDYRPDIASKVDDMSAYDTIYLGFPIWWYVAPTIINTFLESYDLSGKRIALFATSGSSGMGRTIEELKPSAPKAVWLKAQRLSAHPSEKEIAEFLKD